MDIEVVDFLIFKEEEFSPAHSPIEQSIPPLTHIHLVKSHNQEIYAHTVLQAETSVLH